MPQRNPYIDCLRLLVLMALFSFVPQVAALEWGPVGGPDYYDPARIIHLRRTQPLLLPRSICLVSVNFTFMIRPPTTTISG